MKHANTRSNPEFTALSYTWGDAHPTYDIFVCGSHRSEYNTLTVSQNLHSFLSMVTTNPDWDSSIWLWIDQICIHQADLSERTHQVGLMADLYSSATQMFVWLGSVDQVGERSLKRLFDEPILVVALNDGSSPGHQSGFNKLNMISEQWTYRRQYKAQAKMLFTPYIPGLEAIPERPYWRRIWIIQEILLAMSIILYVGNWSITWEESQNLPESIGHLSSRTDHTQIFNKLREAEMHIRMLEECR